MLEIWALLFITHSTLLLDFFPCSLVAFTILKQAWRNKPTCMLPRFDNQNIPRAQEWKHIYAGAGRQSQVPTVNTPSPSAFWPYLRNITFLTGTTEKINWSSILRIQSTYHSCKPKNTFAQWSSPLLHSYKMWKGSHKSHTSNTTKQLPRSFLKSKNYFSLSIY